MSAFLCNPDHIAALAAHGAKLRVLPYAWRDLDGTDDAAAAARRLAEANIASLYARYDDRAPHFWAEWGTPEAFAEACAERARGWAAIWPPELSPVALLKMAGCYSYQASEVSGWQSTDAWKFCYYLEQRLIQMLPGYDEAPWEWHAPPGWKLEAARLGMVKL